MGEVLGRYHIISELGRGGMGVVYKALDPKLERFIAIKCLSEELSEDEIVVARFLREARNVAALNHPNIAQIFVADEHDGKPYFVMEYVDGESLADFIDREGQCSPEMARRVTEQAANALAAAAEEGIVHRDVKPGNIMIDRRGRAVLTDFGIACIAAEQADSGSQTIMGTPGYLAPEALTGEPVDSRSDMFALGAVWYEMLTGQRLMPGRDLKETYAQLAGGDFPDLSTLEGRADDRVIEIMRRLLAIKPGDRYDGWSALLADMAPLKTGRTGPVERPDSGPSTAEREVTEALATARMNEQATAASGASVATAVLQGEHEHRQQPVAVQQQSSRRRSPLAAVALVAVLVLVLAGAGFGLTRLEPSVWNRVTAWLPGQDSGSGPEDAGAEASAAPGDDVASRQPGAAADPAAALRASQALADDTSEEKGPEPDSSTPEPVEPVVDRADSEQALAVADTSGNGSPPSTSGDSETAPAEDASGVADGRNGTAVDNASGSPGVRSDERLAMADSARNTEAGANTVPAEPVTRAPPPPRGIVVIGVGDPVIADPMVREIESALRGSNHPLVERSFVRGYRDYIRDEEVDLASLAEAALDAGARYAVVARALPAGERQLEYYNRVETAFIAQLEATTYDLHEMRRMGSSPVEQIEFTALNATRRAVDSVEPWLAGIKSQFD